MFWHTLCYNLTAYELIIKNNNNNKKNKNYGKNYRN